MITTDTGAKKWENSDNWRQIYQAHNDSVDAEDAAIAALQDGLAIVANGNTHAAIAAGQFVFVKNHDTLAAGLYTANSAIAANATLTSSNLTADPSGGLNALNSNLANKADATEIASRFQHASGNATSYQFDAPGKGGSSYYKFGLVMFGINANDLGVYYVCIVDGTTLYSKPIIAPTNRTVTISLSDSKVTVTLNSTIYGGMSLLWVI